MPHSVFVEVLCRAAELLGGRAQLRGYLRVSMRDLDAWMHGAARPPAYVFLKAVDLVRGEPDPALNEAVRRSRELRRRSELLAEAAEETRARALAVYRRVATLLGPSGMRALLLKRQDITVVRQRTLTARDFAAAQFAHSDGALIVDSALNAALNSTAASRGHVQLASPEGLRVVAQLGFSAPFLGSYAECFAAYARVRRVVVSDVQADPLYRGTPAAEILRQAGAKAFQSTALIDASGERIGLLSTHYEVPWQPSAEELAAIDLIAERTAYWLGGHGAQAIGPR